MRIIFLGIHNKPGKTPLDSSTASGKTIDAIIARLGAHDCVKANLFDTDYLPSKREGMMLCNSLWSRLDIRETDVLVLLGNRVQSFLKDANKCSSVLLPHPSLRGCGLTREKYVESTVMTILNLEPYLKKS